MITKEQAEQIKAQLLKQLENLPEEQREPVKKQIESMDEKQLEEFMKQNIQASQNQSPFRAIIDGKIPSYKIAENDLAIAILEINPISKGHTIIIPKTPVKSSNLPEQIIRFAQFLASHLKNKLECKDIQIAPSEILDEAIINLLPIYKDETFESPRKKASEEELKKLQEQLNLPPEKPQTEIIKQPSTPDSKPVEEPEKEKPKPKKKRKTPINKLPKFPKRQP
jgi:histidine triad (HIT) family protein